MLAKWSDMLCKVVQNLLSRTFLMVLLCTVSVICKWIDSPTYQMLIAVGVGVLQGKKYMDKKAGKEND